MKNILVNTFSIRKDTSDDRTIIGEYMNDFNSYKYDDNKKFIKKTIGPNKRKKNYRLNRISVKRRKGDVLL